MSIHLHINKVPHRQRATSTLVAVLLAYTWQYLINSRDWFHTHTQGGGGGGRESRDDEQSDRRRGKYSCVTGERANLVARTSYEDEGDWRVVGLKSGEERGYGGGLS